MLIQQKYMRKKREKNENPCFQKSLEMIIILIYKPYLNPTHRNCKNKRNCGNLSINCLFKDIKKLLSVYCDNRNVIMFIKSPHIFSIKLFEITIDDICNCKK